MAKELPAVGQGYHLKGPAMPGTGEVIAVLRANLSLTQEEVMLYYGIKPEDGLAYEEASRAHRCDRVVIRRDDVRRNLIAPPELLRRIADKIHSPECPGCHRLVPFQKWHGRCPLCGHVHDPEFQIELKEEM